MLISIPDVIASQAYLTNGKVFQILFTNKNKNWSKINQQYVKSSSQIDQHVAPSDIDMSNKSDIVKHE